MTHQTWFITGASSGLGAAIARAALAAGHRVAATARDDTRLGTLLAAYPQAVLPLSMDLTRPAEIDTAINAAHDWAGGIDVLVNNAAIGYHAAVEEGENRHIRTLFETNFFGVAATIRAALPGMRGQGRGTIVNISSVAGRLAMPSSGYYSATKFALEGLTEALAQEVEPLGIRVMSVEPGGMRTGIVERNLASPRLEGYAGTAHVIMDMLKNDGSGSLAPSDPERVAKVILEVVESGDMPRRLIVGVDSWAAIMAKLDAEAAEYARFSAIANSTSFTSAPDGA